MPCRRPKAPTSCSRTRRRSCGAFPGCRWTASQPALSGARGEGWFDAHAYLQLFRRALRTKNIDFINASVTGIERDGDRLSAVLLDTGERLEAGTVVNAAGPNAGKVSALAGIALPVEPRKRSVFVFEARDRFPDMPLIVDPSGIYVRPEGTVYITGGAEQEDGETAGRSQGFRAGLAAFRGDDLAGDRHARARPSRRSRRRAPGPGTTTTTRSTRTR